MQANKPELLSPCGSPAALRAAVEAGADAVYLGGAEFNARMSARNFDLCDIAKGVEYAHENGVKVYIALNTQIYDRRMSAALAFAHQMYKLGVDALIITDLGLISLIRENIPELPLHASTQLIGHNAAAARFLAELGFERMVCARELSRENIRSLTAESPIEIEAFIHGAICASQSGGCLFSSVVGGRSGNRGECAQPCRLPYNGEYPLSLKDMCLAGHLPQLCEDGIASLKIEGRMKSPDYVRGVTAVYRTLLDEERCANGKEMAYLSALFSRSGFTDGYYTGKPDGKMVGVRTDADKAARIPALKLPKPKRKAPISIKRPSVTLTDTLPKPPATGKAPRLNSARFYDASAIPDTDFFDIVYLPLHNYSQKANGILLPPVIPPDEYDKTRSAIAQAKSLGAQHILVCNIGQLELAAESGLTVHLDYRFNVYNTHAAHMLSEYGEVMLSPELTVPQMRDIKNAHTAIVYGRLPLMTLERPTGKKELIDRRRVRFPIIREGGRELVLNCMPIYMADREKDLQAAGITHRHFIFTKESPSQVLQVIKNYKEKTPPSGAFTRIKVK